MFARSVCKEVGVSYRQLDYWIKNGVSIGTQQKVGSGYYRDFDELEIKILRVLVVLARLLPSGDPRSGGLSKTNILKVVCWELRNDPVLMQRNWLIIDTIGVPVRDRHNVEGWIVNLKEIFNEDQ